MEKKELRYLEKPLVLLLTDKKVIEFFMDYKFSASWEEAKKCEAIMKMKEHIFYGVKDIVSELLDKAREEVFTKKELEVIEGWCYDSLNLNESYPNIICEEAGTIKEKVSKLKTKE